MHMHDPWSVQIVHHPNGPAKVRMGWDGLKIDENGSRWHVLLVKYSQSRRSSLKRLL